MSDKEPDKPKKPPFTGIATDRGLPPIHNILPMPKVTPPKQEKKK